MIYYTRMHLDDGVKQITKEEARDFLLGTYKRNEVKRWINEEKEFHLFTPYREIWAVTEKDRLQQMKTYYGVNE